MQTRLSHVEVMLAISLALGVAAWFGESKLWDYAFIASLVLFVVVFVVSLFKRKR
jgi:membrane protein YdbS with pleckstrin-like domain